MNIQAISSQPTASSLAPINPSGASTASLPLKATDMLATTNSVVADNQNARPVEAKELESAVEKVQSFTQKQAKELQFNIDKDSGRTVIKVVDTSTQEVIRQIPSEEMLSMAKALDQLQGLLIKQKV